MLIKDCYSLGYITKTHGIQGQLVFFLDVDNPLYYKNLKNVFVFKQHQLIPFIIKSINIKHNQTAIVQIVGIETIEIATQLVGSEIYLPLTALPELKGNAFYFHEVIGFSVVDSTHGAIGKVVEVVEGSQPLFVIDNNGKEILCPMHDSTLAKVDRDTNTIHIHLPAGLYELYMDIEEEDSNTPN